VRCEEISRFQNEARPWRHKRGNSAIFKSVSRRRYRPRSQAPENPSAIRLFQVKNKTGSAKGGDGARLGRQLKLLEQTYGAKTFFVAIVGNTLRGHRSKGAVLRESSKYGCSGRRSRTE